MKDLRTIVLFDSEVNHTYKHIVREAIRASIYHRKIAPEQYIRPQHSAAAHVINWILVFDFQRYLRQPLSLACSDLKMYYDRIVHQAASLALQCLGTPIMSIISILDTIQRMLHKVRTS